LSRLLATTLGVKGALFALLVFAVARQDLPQFHGKAILGRAIAYPIAIRWGTFALGLGGSCLAALMLTRALWRQGSRA
jgi:hypothetical protein